MPDPSLIPDDIAAAIDALADAQLMLTACEEMYAIGMRERRDRARANLEILVAAQIARAEAAEARVREMEEDGGWRPIETAPKDGPVTVFQAGEYAVSRWMTSVEEGDGQWIIYRQLSIHEGGALSIRMPNPTHWRPLPEPPTDAMTRDGSAT